MLRVLLLALSVIFVVSFLPVESTQPSAYADPAFSRYQKLAGAQGRAMLWGGDPLVAVVEPYTGAPGNRRLVEYYERGRMEISGADSGTVTEGLLVREMVNGTVQQGDDVVVQESAADVPILGSTMSGSADVPTYADFSALTAPRLDAPGGSAFDTWIDGDGTLSEREPPVRLTAGRYVPETGHMVPEVLTAWERNKPFGSIDPLSALGYPITDPYWTTTGLSDGGVSLIQLFERRVVVYTPDLAAGERFSLTSTGRHYYRWRYGVDPTAALVDNTRSIVPVRSNNGGLTLPDNLSVTTLPLDVDDIVDIAVAPNGDLALAHSDGTVRVANADGEEYGEDPFLDGLSTPVAIEYSGTNLYVSDADGLHRFHDADGDRVIDSERTVTTDRFVSESITLVAGPEGTLYLSGIRRETPRLGQSTRDTARSLLRINADGSATELPTLDGAAGGAMVADENGMLWIINTDNQLAMLDPTSGRATPLLNADTVGPVDRVTGLLVYRSDGAVGDPSEDLLALVTDDDSGKVIRVRPTTQDAVSGKRIGTPDAVPRPGSIVDYVTGFEHPVVMAAGIDGSLYVLDTAKGSVFRIQPD